MDKAPKTLMSLAEYQAERRRAIEEQERERRDGKPLGIACPECGCELKDPHPGMILTSYPPQINTICMGCGRRGHVYA